jgi:hypothetical protein
LKAAGCRAWPWHAHLATAQPTGTLLTILLKVPLHTGMCTLAVCCLSKEGCYIIHTGDAYAPKPGTKSGPHLQEPVHALVCMIHHQRTTTKLVPCPCIVAEGGVLCQTTTPPHVQVAPLDHGPTRTPTAASPNTQPTKLAEVLMQAWHCWQ